MNEDKNSTNSYTYSQADVKCNQLQASICSNSSYVQLPTLSNNMYPSEFAQLRSCQDRNDKNQIGFTHTTEVSFWDEKFRSDSEYNVKWDENLCIQKEFNWGQQQFPFNSYNDQDKNVNYNYTSQRKSINQLYLPYHNAPNVEYSSYNQNNMDKISFDSVSLASYEENNGQQKYNTDDYIQGSLVGSTLGEFKETNGDLRNNFECTDDYIGLNSYLGLTSNILHFNIPEQQTENSNDESDIVVEETDEEITNLTDDKYTAHKCVVCNVVLTPTGIQFYSLTFSTPVTMTSQKPVFSKLQSLVGMIKLKNCHICNECLGLINAIDHLQSKLQGFKNELNSKFHKNYNNRSMLVMDFKKNNILKKSFSCYRCKYCSKLLTLRNYCDAHMINAKKRKFLCDKCGFLCKTSKIYQKHNCKYTKEVLDPLSHDLFTCFNCYKSFKTKTNLKEHQNFCLGVLPYTCKLSSCGKRFATATRLKNHVKLKHDKKFVAICSICNIGFIKLSDYKTHKITHSTDKKFQCQKCDKSYKTKSNLNFHMKSHNKILPFICSICNKGFMRKEYLETHINNHRGIQAFICPLCPKKFTSQKNLDSHYKYHDGSIQKKICNICGKTLTTSINEHLRVHMNLREFDCNICGLKFNTKGTLMKHKKIKHI